MNIVGGSYGVNGKLRIEDGAVLRITAAIDSVKRREDIESVETSTQKERKFGVIGFIFGVPILAFLGWLFMAGTGALIGVVLAIVGSFYQKKTFVAHVAFKDGSRVTAEGWSYEIQKLIKMTA